MILMQRRARIAAHDSFRWRLPRSERPPESAGGVNKVFTAHSNLNISRLGAYQMPHRCICVVWTRLEDYKRLPRCSLGGGLR